MRLLISGTVQGVGFRPTVYRSAKRIGASGKVWNNGSDVVIDTDKGEELLKAIMEDLPPLARIDSVGRIECEYTGGKGFSIERSAESGEGASIPADSSICDDCIKEMSGTGRRAGYPFTTCTNCGPRFTLLKGMPYDRPLTSMDDFPLCPECSKEFSDPLDRRFHHQTICCPVCGPRYRLEDNDGIIETDDPIGYLAKKLDDGCIAVVKGWGGMHICCNLDRLKEMREWYGRKEKPFAVMARDMQSLKRYGSPTEFEERLLSSPNRPIVLVEKKPSEIADLASPGLDNIGLFLPYTGMHHLLFSKLKHDALVMTSANIPGEPMIVDDAKAKELHADYYLLHNQPILNRADDTVLRAFQDRTQYIRRSRGSVPFHIHVGMNGCAVGLGPQENLTASVADKGAIWPTQYIGNGEKIGVPEYLEEAVRTQMGFLNCKPSIIAIDLHPGYANRPLAKRLASEYGAELLEVQHHWAHAASLLVDNKKESCVALTLDGTGHGDDGTAWGGEVLRSDLDSYKRVAHLEEIPLLGSDRALYDLRRLRFAVDMMNGDENHDFTDQESAVLEKLMGKSVRTTSFGRILDTLSYSLGVCSQRTYDGEPAMKLEPLLAKGSLIDGFETESENGIIRTAHLFHEMKGKKEDIAYSVVYNLMKELVDQATLSAEGSGIGYIGLTGGVSYNRTITKIFVELVGKTDLQPILHNDVPNGDGGVSIGQTAIALRRLRRCCGACGPSTVPAYR